MPKTPSHDGRRTHSICGIPEPGSPSWQGCGRSDRSRTAHQGLGSVATMSANQRYARHVTHIDSTHHHTRTAPPHPADRGDGVGTVVALLATATARPFSRLSNHPPSLGAPRRENEMLDSSYLLDQIPEVHHPPSPSPSTIRHPPSATQCSLMLVVKCAHPAAINQCWRHPQHPHHPHRLPAPSTTPSPADYDVRTPGQCDAGPPAR